MSERLEEIKTRFNTMNELDSFKKLAPTELFFDDIDYLIQQAERVEKLEKENHKLNFEIGSYSLQISEISRCLNKEVEDLKKLSSHMLRGGNK